MVKAIVPSREDFHVSEVVCYQAMVKHYLLALGCPDDAKSHLDLHRGLWEDHPSTQGLEEAVGTMEVIGAVRERMVRMAMEKGKSGAGRKEVGRGRRIGSEVGGKRAVEPGERREEIQEGRTALPWHLPLGDIPFNDCAARADSVFK